MGTDDEACFDGTVGHNLFLNVRLRLDLVKVLGFELHVRLAIQASARAHSSLSALGGIRKASLRDDASFLDCSRSHD